MAHEGFIEEIVTNFFLNTCRLLSGHAVQAAVLCAGLATEHPLDDAEADFIPLTTGSVAEFYIEPMLPLFGDIDVMAHCSTWLIGVAPIGPGRALARPLIRQVGPGQARSGCFHDCGLVKIIISTS